MRQNSNSCELFRGFSFHLYMATGSPREHTGDHLIIPKREMAVARFKRSFVIPALVTLLLVLTPLFASGANASRRHVVYVALGDAWTLPLTLANPARQSYPALL